MNVTDLVTVRINLGRAGSDIEPPTADENREGIVNVSDLLLVRISLGQGCSR